jgi:hypothetical protein
LSYNRRMPRPRRSGLRNHSLGLVICAVLIVWIVLYARADPQTRLDAFYVNSIAD